MFFVKTDSGWAKDCIECKFNERQTNFNMEIKIGEHIIPHFIWMPHAIGY
jgi:hypothetical protein